MASVTGAERLAAAELAGRGVRAGDRVGLLFGGRRWGSFVRAYLGVRAAGGQAVLFSPGSSGPDLVRAVSHARVVGVLCPGDLAPPGLPVWAADPDELADAAPGAPGAAAAPGADLVYPAAPFARPRPCVVDVSTAGLGDGSLVHGWAPGTVGGRYALEVVLSGGGVAVVSPFDADRLGALVAERQAGTVGLTPGLAAAFLASGAAGRHDLGSVTLVVLSGPPSAGLRDGIGQAFPQAVVEAITVDVAPVTEEGAPVAVSQEPMLWHEQFVPGSFNLPCLVRRYEGPLDVPALEWALGELVRRHHPLRSTFGLVDGAPRQFVDDRPFRLAVVEVDGDDEVARLLAEATGRPFDLVRGPLFEPQLVRLGPDDHLLVVRLHHSVFDDWSVDVFRRELSALYAAAVDGAPSPLVEPPVAFEDASRRQRDRLAGGVDAEQRAWWRRELSGAPLAVQLPLGTGQGEPLRMALGRERATRLRTLARQLRATPYMTALAAFSVLVGRATGLDDVVVAAVVTGRERSDVEALIGCFTKKVPVRLRLAGDPTFAELVARTRSSLLDSLSHSALAFDAAVQAGVGAAAAEHGAVPRLAVVFQGETPRQATLTMPGLRTGPYEVRAEARRERHFSTGAAGPSWGDGMYLGTFLLLSFVEEGEGMALVARGLFDRDECGHLLDDFVALLDQVTADPSVRPSGPRRPPPQDGELDVRGLRVSRVRLEGALRAEVGVEDDRLVASMVAPTTTAQLRRRLWAALPGILWPAEVVGAVEEPDPLAVQLAAMWGEVTGRPSSPASSYWQDFSFLQVLAEAREAGLAVGDDDVVRCRTPEMLGAALGARA